MKSSRITEAHFYRYADCPAWIYKDVAVKPREVEPLRELLHVGGLLPEVRREVLASRGFDEVDEEDQEEASVRTLELMASGTQTILHGVLLHGRFLARPDVLERVEGRSRFGSYYYVACFFRTERRLAFGDKLALAFAADVLGLVQAVRPQQGYVLYRRGGAEAFLIEPFEREYQLTLHHIERILSGEEPPMLLSSHCKQSPWFSECVGAAGACDGLVRINRIFSEEVSALEAVGISSVKELAELSDVQVRKKHPQIAEDRLAWIKAQAECLVSGTYKVMRSPMMGPTSDAFYFDIESDPLRDVDYLFGVLEVRGGREHYHAFLAKTPTEEQMAWNQFAELMRANPDLPVYHYGWYEVEEVIRFCRRYVEPESFQAMMRVRLQDLLGILRPSVIFPLSFYSLKDIGAYIGFHWRTAEASGATSVLWYEDYLAKGEQEVLDRLIAYNEDDVQATYALAKWLARAVV